MSELDSSEERRITDGEKSVGDSKTLKKLVIRYKDVFKGNTRGVHAFLVII